MIIKTVIMEEIKSKHSIIAEFYTKHYDELKSYVASRLPYGDEEEDVVQNVFMRLLQMDKMISPVTLPCLAYTTARNIIIDHWRRKRCKEQYEHYIVKGDGLNGYIESEESVYSVREVNELLEHGIAQLTDNLACVYRMNIYDGLQVKEIAQVLQLKYKAAEHRLGDARKEIRTYMKKVLAS